MTPQEVATVVATGFSLVGLSFLGFWLYRDYRVDLFRQQMFALRDKLFDFAAEGHIPFDHAAYRMLRSTFNGYIRFGHRLKLSSALIFVARLRPPEREWIEENAFAVQWEKACEDLEPQTHDVVDKYRERMEGLVARHLIFGSPLLVATIVPMAVFVAIVRSQIELAKKIRDKWSESIGERIDEAALALGESA